MIDYGRQVSPLQKKLDSVLEAKKRTKRVTIGIQIELSIEDRRAFNSVKDLFDTAATLAFPENKATICLFTDASDTGWTVIETQVDHFDSTASIVT